MYAIPFDACAPLRNPEETKGKIVIALRGKCMFVTKSRNIELAGGLAALIAGWSRVLMHQHIHNGQVQVKKYAR